MFSIKERKAHGIACQHDVHPKSLAEMKTE